MFVVIGFVVNRPIAHVCRMRRVAEITGPRLDFTIASKTLTLNDINPVIKKTENRHNIKRTVT